jgi:hypothetical protein
MTYTMWVIWQAAPSYEGVGVGERGGGDNNTGSSFFCVVVVQVTDTHTHTRASSLTK